MDYVRAIWENGTQILLLQELLETAPTEVAADLQEWKDGQIC